MGVLSNPWPSSRVAGPWSEYATIPHRGEDPFLWVDARHNWHALFHTSGNSAARGTHCGNSSVASHAFSADRGQSPRNAAAPAARLRHAAPLLPRATAARSSRTCTFNTAFAA